LLTSQLILELEAGAPILWVVDLWSPTDPVPPEYVLNAQPWDTVVPDGDLMSDVGVTWTGNSTMADTSAEHANCPRPSGKDHFLRWTAPATGTFAFSTMGSEFDTVLSIHTSCDLVGADCVDLAALQPETLTIQLEEGDVRYLRVAGVDDGSGAEPASGTWRLTILQVSP
jgi:hypothetical protein